MNALPQPLGQVEAKILEALARIGGGHITVTNLHRQLCERELRDTDGIEPIDLLERCHQLAQAGLLNESVSVSLAPGAVDFLSVAAPPKVPDALSVGYDEGSRQVPAGGVTDGGSGAAA